MKRNIKAIVTEDHPLMAQATKGLLEQIEEIKVIGLAYSGADCLQLVREHLPDLVLLDYQLPDVLGTELVKDIKALRPEVQIIIFTGVDLSDLAERFVDLQINGIISKGTGHSSILHMIHCVLENYTVFPTTVLNRLQTGVKASPKGDLTEDEILIMKLLIKGETLEQIADAIHVSKRSVDNYQKRIYEKLGVKNKVQALEAFIQSKYYAETGGGN